MWIAMLVVAEAMVFLVQLPLRLRNSHALGIVALVVKALLVVYLAYGLIATTSAFWWNTTLFFGALYCALLGDIAASILCSALRLVHSRMQRNLEAQRLSEKLLHRSPVAAVSLVLGAAILIAGIVNMQTVVCEPYSIESEKLTENHTLAFVADLHAGTSQEFSALEDTVSEINAAHPEFVILGGDVVDEFTSAECLERTCELLGTIEAPTYFVYGNHDRQPDGDLVGGRTFTDDELVAALEGNGIIVLTDEYVTVADDLVLLGREDISAGDARQAGSVLASQNPNPSAFLLVADHQPYGEEDDVAAVRADLQLSGHTHAGQLFPLQFIYNAIGLPAYGEYTLGGSRLWVSSGEAGWAIPLRTEARCTWNLITLEAAE